MTIRAPHPRHLPPDCDQHGPDQLRPDQAAGLRGADPQGGRSGRRPRDRGPAPPLESGPRASRRCRPRRPARPGLDADAPRHDLRGARRADQPVGRPGQPDFPGRDPGPQQARAAPARRAGRASIVIDAQAKAAVVPIEAIVRFAGVTKIFLVDQGKARAIGDIKTGVEGRGWIEVISGQLPPPRDVVTTGQTHLADGTPGDRSGSSSVAGKSASRQVQEAVPLAEPAVDSAPTASRPTGRVDAPTVKRPDLLDLPLVPCH